MRRFRAFVSAPAVTAPSRAPVTPEAPGVPDAPKEAPPRLHAPPPSPPGTVARPGIVLDGKGGVAVDVPSLLIVAVTLVLLGCILVQVVEPLAGEKTEVRAEVNVTLTPPSLPKPSPSR